MISNCGKDENGRYSGGKAGDQTGKEYCIREWYDRPWSCVIRHPNTEVGMDLAEVARSAAKNDHVGYNQSKRGTYFEQLKATKWHPSKIMVNCEADCSSSTCANVVAVGHRLGMKELQKVNPGLTTRNLKPALKEAGFKILTDTKYTKSQEYLLPGDILLSEGHHVAINVSKGNRIK